MTTARDRKYRWVFDHRGTPTREPGALYDGRAGRLFDVGILADGTLHNPHGYPEDVVRQSVNEAIARKHERDSQAAKKAAVTKARRREKKISLIAKRVIERHQTGPSFKCYVCGKGLTDQESIARGIGSDCWQDVLKDIERQRDQRTARAA